MKDIDFGYSNDWLPYIFYLHIQLKKPFLVKSWCFVDRGKGNFTIHLFPFHFYFNRTLDNKIESYFIKKRIKRDWEKRMIHNGAKKIMTKEGFGWFYPKGR